ncbi:MAG TPA: BamA/TamA family outer membrane protein [Bacteroidales bacterium]|nr:BamA/TamA family outer membrane protein [Bacteroidales bacterium]
MKTPYRYITLFVVMLSIILSSCGPSRLTQEGYRLKKNVISSDDRKIETGDLTGYLQQTPNKRFLGLNLYTWIYQQSFKGKERKYKSWFRRKFGEQPVMVDQARIDASTRDMKLYMNNIGYFESGISSTIDTLKKNKARVNYFIKAGKPYTLRNVSYRIKDDTLAHLVDHVIPHTLLKAGFNYSSYTLDDECSRITEMLRNNGYYYFSRDFIRYEIDSSLNSHQMDLLMIIENNRRIYAGSIDSVVESNHKRYRIDHIFIEPHFDPLRPVDARLDTLIYYQLDRKQKDTLDQYVFIYPGALKIKPAVIAQSVYFTQGSFYRLRDATQTNTQLTRMAINRLVNLSFSETVKESHPLPPDQGFLDTRIMITNAPVNSFSIETDITNSAGNPGIAGSLVVQNKNLFGGAELFRIRLRGATELQRSAQEAEKRFLFFNTVEAGIEVSLHFPKFLIPFSQMRFPKYFRPRTSISVSYTYELQPDYIRHLSNGSFGYNWEHDQEKHHEITPLELTSVKIFPDDSSDFYKYINETNDAWLKEQYSDHFIMSSRYSYIFSNQQLNRNIDFIYLNYQVETGGNLIQMIKNLTDAPTQDGKYTIFKMPYAQYLRQEIDFRYYHYLVSRNTLVLRGYAGLGLPYGNSLVMPYERAFPAGGANDMRGWIFRRLGPGSYTTDTIDFDRAGDIKLMANIEYRFPIYKMLKSAVFTDIGNIWLLRESEDFPGGEFAFRRFYKEFAMDAGLGIRLDFDFFIIRLDLAAQIRDPYMPEGSRWIFDSDMKSNVVWNLGIGYPF